MSLPWLGAARGVLDGPFPIRRDDIAPLNRLFSDAFSDRYRRDGMLGVRVPMLNPRIWEYSIDDADGGAMLWRDATGAIAAFCLAHRSGTEGWLGPLAVRTELQGVGAGRAVVLAGLEWLRASGATVIGLETMPRTVDNIGFYSSLGLVPRYLTITLTLDARTTTAVNRLSQLAEGTRRTAMAECLQLTQRLQPGYDFSREIELTASLALGDTVFVSRDGAMTGFAVCHDAPLIDGREREEVRVLKCVVADDETVVDLVQAIRGYSAEQGARRMAIRMQSVYERCYQKIVALGARVRWTDLRMTLAEAPEAVATRGAVLSNWEI